MFSANQKPFVICTRVTEELHSFLSQSELSNFFVYIIWSSRLWSVDSCQNRVSANPCYMTVSRAQVYIHPLVTCFLKFFADQILDFN